MAWTIDDFQNLIGLPVDSAQTDVELRNALLSVASTDGLQMFELQEAEVQVVYVDVVDGLVARVVRVQ